MKSGSAQIKPTLSARMPVRSASESLSDLERVDVITEVPAARAAAVILESRAGKGAAPAKAVPAKPAAETTQGSMPWESGDETGVVHVNFKFPNKLFKKLKYFGETTYGASMTSIVTAAVEERLGQMMAERNLK